MQYSHLSDLERETIGQMHFAGHSFSEIGRALGRHKATISREYHRNRAALGPQRNRRFAYYAGHARVKSLTRRRRSKRNVSRVLEHRPLLRYVLRSLKKHWSPEQISGRIKVDFPDDPSMRVSHESIYQLIRQDKQRGGRWYRFLRQSRRLRRKKYGSSLKRYRIQNQTSIDQRPQVANRRKRIGTGKVTPCRANNRRQDC